MLREEQAMLYLTAQINCESVAHANEVVHQVKRFLPTTKYVQLAPFSSFMQIPNYFFDKDNNNPEKHNIDNLFLKYEPTTGEKNFFFKANYKPLIKLNSCNAEISDNSSRSFVVLCDFNYLIQLPMWLFDTYNEPHILRINLNITTPDSLPCIIVDNNFLSVNDEPYKIMDFCYDAEIRYLIEPNTFKNYHDGRICLPMPSSKEFIIQVAKLYQKKSTVVNWISPYNALPMDLRTERHNFRLNTSYCNSKVLDDDKFAVIRNKETGNDEIIIFAEGNPDFTPDIASPVIVTILRPVSGAESLDQVKRKTFFSKVYTPKPQSTWRRS